MNGTHEQAGGGQAANHAAPAPRSQDGPDLDLLLRWSPAVFALTVGGLVLASRATDSYTSLFGFLLTGFGLLIGGRLLARVLP